MRNGREGDGRRKGRAGAYRQDFIVVVCDGKMESVAPRVRSTTVDRQKRMRYTVDSRRAPRVCVLIGNVPCRTVNGNLVLVLCSCTVKV